MFICLITSCSNTVKQHDNKENCIIDDYMLIKTENLIDVNVFEREKQLYVIRIFTDDSCKYIQFVCKKNDKGNIYLKTKNVP
jgi:hypothetical protein